MTLQKLIILLLLSLITLFSFFLNYYYGFLGVNPLDNFTNFNSGFSFLKGKYPFKDFWTATGPSLGIFQSFFFKILGFSWKSYVIHASIFNSIIAISLFLFLLKIGLNKYISFLYSILFSVIFYPPVGTPFVDHHSMFFTYLTFFIIVYSLNENKPNLFAFIPIFFLLGLFSKQTPIGYFFILISPVVIYKLTNIKIFYSLLIGLLISILLFYFYINFTNIKLIDIYYQYFLSTSEVGSYRLNNSSFSFYDVFHRYRFIHLSLILFIVLAIKYENFNQIFKISKFQLIYLVLSINFTMIFHQLLSMNQAFILSLIFLNLGLSLRLINFDRKRILNNKFLIFLILFSLYICFKYHFKFNETRRFNDLAYSNKLQNIDSGKYFPSLKNLNWFTNYNNDPKKEIENLKQAYDALKKEKKKYALITDYQFLSLELGIYGNFPLKWFHENVSFPNMKSEDNKKAQLAFSNFFIKKLKVNQIEEIYFVPPEKYREDFIVNIINKHCVIKPKHINQDSSNESKFYEKISIKCL